MLFICPPSEPSLPYLANIMMNNIINYFMIIIMMMIMMIIMMIIMKIIMKIIMIIIMIIMIVFHIKIKSLLYNIQFLSIRKRHLNLIVLILVL